MRICWYLKKRAAHIQVFTSLSCTIGFCFKIERYQLNDSQKVFPNTHLIKWWTHCKYLFKAFNKLMDLINIKWQEESKSLNYMKFRVALFQGNKWARLPPKTVQTCRGSAAWINIVLVSVMILCHYPGGSCLIWLDYQWEQFWLL